MRTLKLSPPPGWLLDAGAVLALFVLVLAFNPDLAFRGMVLGGYDTFVYFHPLRAYFAQAVAEGRLPLWNPNTFLGVPFLANPQSAVFYPGTWLFALVAVPHAYVANFLGHVFIAGASLYAFARWLGLGRLGSLIGGCSFAFSGFLSGQAGHINQVSVAAWLPLVALALGLALDGGRPWALTLLVGGLVLQLLAGHPQEVYMTLVALGVLALWHRWGQGLRPLLSGWAALALAAGLAFGIAAIQLVPTAELAGLSIRAGRVDYAQATVDALPWQLLLPGLLPGFWSHLHTTELFGHLGTIVLAVAWLGLLAGAGRPAALGALLVVLGLGLAVGNANPLYRLLFDWAPGFSSFRVPARWLFIYTFGASLLVATGASWLVGAGSPGWRSLCSRGWRSLRAPTDPGALRLPVVGLGLPLVFAALALFGQRQSRLLLLIWAGLAGLTVLAALVALVAPRLRAPALALLLGGGLVELWLAGADLEHRHAIPNVAYGQPRESRLFLQSREGIGDGRFRMLSIATPEYEVKESPEYRERFGWLHPEALKNLLVAVKWNETLIPNVPLEYHLSTADGYDGGVLPLAGFVKLPGAMLGPDRVRPDGVLASRLDRLPEARWLDLLGVRYVLAGRIKDITRDGLYYDRALTATLRPGQRLELRSLPLGEFNRLGVMSSYRGPSRPGSEVARLELDAADAPTVIPLLDGTHTAAADAEPGDGGALDRVQEWGASGPDAGADWVAQVEFPRRPVTGLTIVNTTPDATLEIRALNLVDDVRRASFSLPMDDRVERTEFFDMKVYDRREALPRAYLATGARVLDDDAALRRLADPSFDPRSEILLAPSASSAAIEAVGSPSGTAELEVSEAEHVRIRTRSDGPAYLVLSDSWYPGWRASVDGTEAPISRANVLFRAVPVPAGDHVIELVYEPTSLRLGAAISAGSMLVGLAAWWVSARRRRTAAWWRT
jgi:hypothetical protein